MPRGWPTEKREGSPPLPRRSYEKWVSIARKVLSSLVPEEGVESAAGFARRGLRVPLRDDF